MLNKNENPAPFLFEDERVFNEEQLITLRLPVAVLNYYKEEAIKSGEELSVVIANRLQIELNRQ